MTNTIIVIKSQLGGTFSKYFDSSRYDGVFAMADNLGPGEKVDIYMLAGAVDIVLSDPFTGTAVTLTPGHPGVYLQGGPQYKFIKTATAVPCAVYVVPKLK